MPSSLLLGQPDGGPGSSAHPGRGPYPLPFERRPLSTTLVAPTVTVTNDFEGGTNGVAITTANAGGVGNTQFDQVTVSAGDGAVNFSNAHPGHGSLGMLCQTGATLGEAYVSWIGALGGATGTIWLRAYLYLTANPGTQTRLLRWLNVGNVRGSVQISTTGKLLTTDFGGAGGTMINSIPLNQLVRVEAFCTGDGTAGVLECKLFDSPESNSPLETITNTALNTVGMIDRVRFGQTGTAVANITYWLDDIGASTSAYLGPVGAAAALILGIVLLLVVGGIAYASIPGSDGVIHACYKNSNPAQGALIAIDSAASCPSGYTALNWNQIGPQGPTGPQGAPGISGLEIVVASGTVPNAEATTFFAEATCPSGKHALGGGAGIGSLPAGRSEADYHLVHSQSGSISDMATWSVEYAGPANSVGLVVAAEVNCAFVS